MERDSKNVVQRLYNRHLQHFQISILHCTLHSSGNYVFVGEPTLDRTITELYMQHFVASVATLAAISVLLLFSVTYHAH